jgi:hypothetical protein
VHRNTTTNAHNVYLTFTHTRRLHSATGWTAVGVGDEMEGSLMFILYGDPSSGEDPIISIRKSPGHAQPTLVTAKDLGGGDLLVLRSSWLPHPSEPGSTTAIVSLVCYSCTLWPGTSLSASTTSQPWIWAWNQKQSFSVYSYDAHLLMHKHHAGNGGWGRFYVNMNRAQSTSINLPSVPAIRPGVATLGTSDSPGLFTSNGIASWLRHSPVLHLHGALMAIAFMLLFPAGVFSMRSGSSKSFKHHWVIQAAASVTAAGGAIAGLTLQPIGTVHQMLGIAVTAGLGFQAYLGWKHHVIFVRILKRTWVSFAHIWTGRAIMLLGYVNLVLGLVLRGYPGLSVALLCVFSVIEILSMVFFVRRQQRKAARRLHLGHYQNIGEGEDDNWAKNQDVFTVASEEDDEGED